MQRLLKFYAEGAETTRYHTVRTIQQETVGHHSHGVAMFCVMLSESPSPALLIAALAHDLAEHQLGDIPSPAKKQYGIGEKVNALEARLLADVGLDPTLTPDEKRTLKLADIFQGILFCTREIQLGNRGMRVILERYMGYAEDHVLVGREKIVYNELRRLNNGSE